jgi:hypothetical protein
MSAINSSIISSTRKCYVNNGLAVGDFGVGNDTTGDGTAANPYFSGYQAMLEWYTAEPNPSTHFTIAFLSASGEGNDYGEVACNTTQAPATDPQAICNFTGWLKSWGDVNDEGVWTDIEGGEKPKVSFDYNFGSNVDHIYFNNVNVAATGASSYYYFNPSGKEVRAYGCVIEANASNEINRVYGAGGVKSVVHASYFNDARIYTSSPDNGGASTVYVSGSYGKNNTRTEMVYETTSPNRKIHLMGCYLRNTLNTQHMFKNGSANSLASTVKEGNHYEYIGGGTGNFAEGSSAQVYADFAAYQTANPTVDVYAGEGSGVSTSVDDPTPTGNSRLNDKGARFITEIIDQTSKDRHLKDFLGYYYGDAIDPIASGGGEFTQRSVGPTQVLTLRTSPVPLMVNPANFDLASPYVVLQLQADRDEAGNGEVLLRQYSDPSATTLTTQAESKGIVVTTGVNDKIDFNEGGGELTATLAAGEYNTTDFIAEVKAKLDTAGADTYTVTRNSTTESYNIASTGTFSMPNATGTNTATSAAVLLMGYKADTGSAANHSAELGVAENFYESSLTWEYSTDYDGSSDPDDQGTWLAKPAAGFDISGAGNMYVRVDYDTLSTIQNTYFKAAVDNGNQRTARIA